jgi:hypothetical protein
MNPINSPSSASGPEKVADTVSPASEPVPAAGVEAEIVKDIPIKQQISQDSPAPAIDQATSHNPVSSDYNNPIATGSATSEDTELDGILTDVSKEVRNNTALTQKAHHKNSESKTTHSAAVIVVAVLVVGLLIAAAIYAFQQNSESTLNF